MLSHRDFYLHCHRLSLEPIFVHRWRLIDHVTGKQASSLVVETFDWHHVMTTAVERNGRMRRLVTFVRRIVCIRYIKRSKIMLRTVEKNINIKNAFHFFLMFIKVWTQWVPCKVNLTPFNRYLLCAGSIAFIIPWTSEKWNLFLKYIQDYNPLVYAAHDERHWPEEGRHLSRDMTKPTKWVCASEDSDQPGRPPSLIGVFSVCSMGS